MDIERNYRGLLLLIVPLGQLELAILISKMSLYQADMYMYNYIVLYTIIAFIIFVEIVLCHMT